MSRPIAPALLWLAALLSLWLPALAFAVPNATTQQDASQLVLKNLSGAEIAQARVQTTDGQVWNLGQGLAQNHATQIVIPPRDCIANIAVQLKNGRKLQEAGLHACNQTQIVVRPDGITIPQQAIPGAQQRGTPR